MHENEILQVSSSTNKHIIVMFLLGMISHHQYEKTSCEHDGPYTYILCVFCKQMKFILHSYLLTNFRIAPAYKQVHLYMC